MASLLGFWIRIGQASILNSPEDVFKPTLPLQRERVPSLQQSWEWTEGFPKRKIAVQNPPVSFYDCWREGKSRLFKYSADEQGAPKESEAFVEEFAFGGIVLANNNAWNMNLPPQQSKKNILRKGPNLYQATRGENYFLVWMSEGFTNICPAKEGAFVGTSTPLADLRILKCHTHCTRYFRVPTSPP